MRSALLAALFACAVLLPACGDDTTSPPSGDLAVIVLDLSTPANGQACGATTCSGSCTACVALGGGLCAIPCNTATPSTCSTGHCVAAAADDGGISITFAGNCAPYNGACG